MKVYELIQELTQFRADTEVEFAVKADFDADVDVDLEGEANQTVSTTFDDTVSFDEIKDEEYRLGRVTIKLEY